MYNIVELFSGIGSQARALKNLGIQTNIVGTSEWDIHAIIAYDYFHNKKHDIPEEILQWDKNVLLEKLKDYTFSNTGKEALQYQDLKTYSLYTLQRLYTAIKRNNNYVDINNISGNEMPDNIDIMTYSFPCQDLSNVGAFHGYNKGIDKDSGSRSSLLWQVGRILSEMKNSGKTMPKFLLMENVPALLSKRHFPNFSNWIAELYELGYVSKYYELNASSFGLPQNRPRLLMISVYVGEHDDIKTLVHDYFQMKATSEQIVNDYQSSKYYRKKTIKDLLRIDYSQKALYEEALTCTPNDTVSRRDIWNTNPQIILEGGELNSNIEVVRTITTKQDRNPNSGNLYFDSGLPGKSRFRYLTPRECLLFMGFTDDDYMLLKNDNIEFHKDDYLFSRDKIIKMAGNSIPVKLLEGIFLQIIKIDHLISFYKTYTKEDCQESKNNVIKSNMFKKGIRSRATLESIQKDANIVYPKYYTAIFLRDAFWAGDKGIQIADGDLNKEYWLKIIKENKQADNKLFKLLNDNGWNVIVIWDFDESKNNKELYNNLLDIISSNYPNRSIKGKIFELR